MTVLVIFFRPLSSFYVIIVMCLAYYVFKIFNLKRPVYVCMYLDFREKPSNLISVDLENLNA